METDPKVLEGSLKKLHFANVFHPFSVQKVQNDPMPLSALNSHTAVSHGNSLLQVHGAGEEGALGRACHREGLHLHRGGREDPRRAPAPRSCKRKIQSHVSSLNRHTSEYQANSKGNVLTAKTRMAIWSLRSIILPGIGSCWLWSGMAQTTSAAGHPGKKERD